MPDRLWKRRKLRHHRPWNAVASIYKISDWLEYIFEYIDAVIDYKLSDGDVEKEENVQRLYAVLLIMAGHDDNRRAMLSDEL